MKRLSLLALVTLSAVLLPRMALAQSAVTSFTLINADSNQPIAAFDPFIDGAVLDLRTLPSPRLNVRANVSGTVGSVLFGLDDNPNARMESVAPFALAGDTDGNYNPWTPSPGPHTLTATPFTAGGGGGSAGTPLTITFTVVTAPTPTPGPEPAPAVDVHTYVAVDGVVTVEVESQPPADDWSAETAIRGFTGDCYYTWRGPDLFGSPGSGVLTYRIRVDAPGTWHLRIRNYHDNPDGSEENDCWVRMNDGHWAKLWSPTVNAWNWISHFDFSETNKPPASYALDAGDHTFQISGRSHKFRIDRFVLHRDGAADPLDESRRQSDTVTQPAIAGELKQWHRVSLTFAGPDTSEANPWNPFLNYRFRTTFTGPGGRFDVPGFYAADGNAAETGASGGDQWRVHFAPNAPGEWHYTTAFHQGEAIAVSTDPLEGAPTAFHGLSGRFTVAPSDKVAPDFRARGLLEYVDGHHLRFAGDGTWYLKGGADSPENFLAYDEFDGTFDTGGIIPGFLHGYNNHLQDWRDGDPVWQGTKGKRILGALNYLASKGVNSVYFLTYNVDGGDGADTWPWTGPDERQRYDCSKLDQWEIVFQHMDALGIQLHVVTQENENDRALDGGELGITRHLYYRELVARFSHHLAVQWNLGEENTNTDAQRLEFARAIRRLDPYRHPIAVHTFFDHPDTYYDGLLGKPNLEATSLQGQAVNYNRWARSLRERSAAAGQPWAVYGDEQAPAVDKHMGNLGELRRNALWGNLMGGGAGVEWYFGYQDDFGDMQSEDFRVAEPLWDFTRHALEFFQTHLPFQEMTPDNNIVTGADGALALAKAGEVYAVYLPNGGSPTLAAAPGTYAIHWYNPRTGGELQTGELKTIAIAEPANIGAPPSDAGQDWLVLLRNTQGGSAMQVR